MTVATLPTLRSSQLGPWFRRHPVSAVTVAGGLFAAVLVLRLLSGNVSDAFSLLYALPVALIASTLGLRAGTLAGLVAIALIAVWVLESDISLTPSGWLSRVVPLLLLGVLLGQATDQANRAEEERRRMETSALLHQEAIEINDMLVQGLAAARLYFESGDVDTGRRILDETIAQARELVSGLIRRADMGRRAVSVTDDPSPRPPDR